MNHEFISLGIKEDRYLKAIRLINRFEKEVRAELEHTSEAIVERNRDLFAGDVSKIWSRTRDPGSSLGTLRIDSRMDRITSPDDPSNLKLNLALEWVDPVDRGDRTQSGGSLCSVHYKVKNCPSEDYQAVKRETKGSDRWTLYCGQDVWGSAPGVFYYPVRTAEELKEGLVELGEHFSTFGEQYGVQVDPANKE